MNEYNEGFDRGYKEGYRSGYAQGRHEMLMELSKSPLNNPMATAGPIEHYVSICRCGHENADHKQMFDEGRPTSQFPCTGYGCVCGVFEVIDWDEADANHEAFMDYQRSITL